MEDNAPHRANAGDFAIFYKQFVHRVLPDIQVGDVVKYFAPSPDKLLAVALCTRTPHRRAFRSVEHAELNRCAVGHNTSVSTERVNLAYYLSLGNATNGRIATHLPDLVHIHCDKTGLRSHISCGSRCLASRVACTNHNDIVEKFHYTYL